MSKKETEFDRFDRMKKLEREAEVAKRKNVEINSDERKKSSKPKSSGVLEKNWSKKYDLLTEDEYDNI